MASSTTMPSMTENEGVRRRSLSGASALLARRFTRQTSAPRPTASRSESTTNRRRATIAATSDNMIQQTAAQQDVKVHVRIVPNIDNPSRSLIFDIVDRQLEVGSIIRIGRYSERHANMNCMSFRSKVVSRLVVIKLFSICSVSFQIFIMLHLDTTVKFMLKLMAR